MADALVEFDSVVKRFGDFTAVETMNFTIDEGEFIAIMGCLLYTSPSPRDRQKSRMPSSA